MDTLIQTDEEIKSIILSDKPDLENEEIYYSFGNGSFSYKLKSDINNFDRLLMANALIDMIVSQNFDSLLKEHMEIFMLCAGRDPHGTINVSQQTEHWFKFFQKFKDFLLIAICDEELVDSALVITHNFLTSPNLKFQVYDDCKQSLQRSIELLFDGTSKVCQQKFTRYLEEKVVQRTEDTDNALKKFFKGII